MCSTTVQVIGKFPSQISSVVARVAAANPFKARTVTICNRVFRHPDRRRDGILSRQARCQSIERGIGIVPNFDGIRVAGAPPLLALRAPRGRRPGTDDLLRAVARTLNEHVTTKRASAQNGVVS